jgi:hypothetical protein
MAINKNHEFEELTGIKCAIVERKVSQSRMEFLKHLLTFNGYTVVVAGSPPEKAAAPKEVPPADPAAPVVTTPVADPVPETFTIGVTDVSFNPTNAIFGRLLHTPEGQVVTLAYWQQKDSVSHDDVPYFGDKSG